MGHNSFLGAVQFQGCLPSSRPHPPRCCFGFYSCTRRSSHANDAPNCLCSREARSVNPRRCSVRGDLAALPALIDSGLRPFYFFASLHSARQCPTQCPTSARHSARHSARQKKLGVSSCRVFKIRRRTYSFIFRNAE